MSSRTEELTRLEGLLLVWTNAPAAALPILTPILKTHPDDTDVRLGVVDAFRATERAYEACDAAAPLSGNQQLPADRQVMLAELALEADRPSVAFDIASRPGV